jgi:nicotinate-nucleotide adenylyltransferase
MQPIGIFGGTFDPIHHGHLRTALELLTALELAEVRFVPAANPPHRGAPMIDGALRLRMVQAAIANQAGFVADEREVRRDGPSYTVDTLRSLRADYPTRALCLLLGMDAFLGLTQWHRWQALLELAHIVIANRPGWRTPEHDTLGELLREHRARDPRELHDSLAGRVHIEPVTQLEISSTGLRAAIRSGVDPRFLVPDSVRDIIVQTECYAKSSEESD